MSIKSLHQKKFLWILALGLVIGIKLFSLSAHRVEALYTSKFYYFFSKMLRVFFGWIPFSFGDILYLIAGAWLLLQLIKNIRTVFKRQLNKKEMFRKSLKFILLIFFIYSIFNIFWGLNYNRKGIANELELPKIKYDTSEIKIIQQLLLQKVNASKEALINENFIYPGNEELFRRAQQCYDDNRINYPFLQYKKLSVKSSMFGWLGNYWGFTGYYNPFTGEAQVNTTVPKFLQPYITTHEIAHQLGYAKENEANFAGYLAAANSRDTLFHYSVYLDLFMYASREVYYFDSVASKQTFNLLIPPVKKDIEEWKRFNLDHTSFMEPVINWMYGNFLKLNQQPQGLRSYNEVIAMLISYYKKFGKI